MSDITEQVRRLGAQAGMGAEFKGYSDLYNTRLIELVVQECIQVLEARGAPNVHGEHIGVAEIKQHFGLK